MSLWPVLSLPEGPVGAGVRLLPQTQKGAAQCLMVDDTVIRWGPRNAAVPTFHSAWGMTWERTCSGGANSASYKQTLI